jgi:hypothetical protein
MTNKNITLFIALLVVALGAYFLFVKSAPVNTAIQNDSIAGESEMGITYCDGAGNRYSSEAEAKAAGLSEAEYGATYCPEYVAAQTGDYRGVILVDAEAIALDRGEMFRVVEIDGEPQPTTRDFQEGRINATVEGGVVTEYFVESMNSSPEKSEPTSVSVNDMILGMTVAEAEMYTKANGVIFRTGTIDGVGMAVTMDFRPGRITAEIKDGLVVGYSAE